MSNTTKLNTYVYVSKNLSIMIDHDKYSKHYSDESFREKIKKFAFTGGKELIGYCLLLYYALRQDDIPAWAKGIILGALGYFILPLDLLPDAIPLEGYSDDFVVILAAVAVVIRKINEETRKKATTQMEKIFGPEKK